MLCDLEPFVVVFNIVGGAEEIIDLLVGEFVCEDLVCDLVDGRVGKLKPARVGEEFVEVFEVWFVDNEFFLCFLFSSAFSNFSLNTDAIGVAKSGVMIRFVRICIAIFTVSIVNPSLAIAVLFLISCLYPFWNSSYVALFFNSFSNES